MGGYSLSNLATDTNSVSWALLSLSKWPMWTPYWSRKSLVPLASRASLGPHYRPQCLYYSFFRPETFFDWLNQSTHATPSRGMRVVVPFLGGNAGDSWQTGVSLNIISN